MFSRIGPQALPGTAFHGIIPEIPQQKKPLILAINTWCFLFLSYFFCPLASCVPILGIHALTSTALSWQEELKSSLKLHFLLIPRLAAKICSQTWFSHMAAKWLDFCASGPVSYCLLAETGDWKGSSASQRYLASFRTALIVQFLTRLSAAWTTAAEEGEWGAGGENYTGIFFYLSSRG